MLTAHLAKAIPQLPSSDLNKTKTFLIDKLGFECLADYSEMIIFKRDAVELHYWLCADDVLAKNLAQNSSCYFRVENIEELYQKLKNTGVDFGYELEEKPWGVNEMQVNDPDGNALRFGEALSKA